MAGSEAVDSGMTRAPMAIAMSAVSSICSILPVGTELFTDIMLRMRAKLRGFSPPIVGGSSDWQVNRH